MSRSQREIVEGPTLQQVMREIRNRHGARARVVEANRVRTGGVGGFFASEHVEVVIDLTPDDEPVVTSRPAAPVGARARRNAYTSGPAAADRAPIDRLLDAVDPDGPLPSTERSSFAQVLEQVARATEPPSAPRYDAGPGPDGSAGPGAAGERRRRPWRRRGAEAAPSSGPAAAASSAGGTARADAQPAAGSARTAPTSPASPATVRLPGQASPATIQAALDGLAGSPLLPDAGSPLSFAAAGALPAAGAFPAAGALPAAGSRPVPGTLMAELAAASSVPALRRSSEAAPPPRLRTALDNVRRIPVLAPRTDVVVMVVDASPVTDRTVRRLAFDLDLESAAVMDLRDDATAVLDGRLLAAVARRRAAGSATLVVVSPHGPGGPGAIGDLNADLRPNQIVCCADAAATAEDIGNLSRAVGGLDVLEITGIRHRDSAVGGPWHLLATGIPVASLDGRRTSPALWTKLAGLPARSGATPEDRR